MHVRLIVALLALATAACYSNDVGTTRTGLYLGETPPGTEPTLFAPGIVSTGLYTRDIAMTPEGDELYYTVVVGRYTAIIGTRLVHGRWTAPEVAPFSTNPNWANLEPHISPDGRRFYFVSNRPRDGGTLPPEHVGSFATADIWVMERTSSGWGEPHNLGEPVNTDAPEFFPSLTRDGTIYFTRQVAGGANYIYRSSPAAGGGFESPQRLGPTVNSTAQQYNAFVAPDETYLLFAAYGRADSRGGSDYYAAFRKPDGTWSEAVNLGDTVNRPTGAEWSPFVSRDGKYFFFMSTRSAPSSPPRLTRAVLDSLYDAPENGNPAIYWMDAEFLSRLRTSVLGN